MPGPEDNAALPRGVGRPDAAAAHDDAFRGEVRPLDVPHKVRKGGVGVVQETDTGPDDLFQVVGGDVGGHAHGDAAGPVHQQVGEPGRQDPGLFPALVEVGIPVHRVLFDVPEHFVGDFGQPGLRIPVGGGGIPVHGTEVAVAVYQHIAHGEVLGQTDHGVIDAGVSVGVVLAQHLAYGGGGLLKGFVGGQAVLVHGIEDPAVDGFQAVPHIRQGPAYNDAHGVFDVGFLHLVHQSGLRDHLVWKGDILGFIVSVMRHQRVSLLRSGYLSGVRLRNTRGV